MYYEKNSREFNVIVGLALGAIVGVLAALVASPRGVRRSTRRLFRS